MEGLFGPIDIRKIERRVVDIERQIGDLRAEQAVLVNELHKAGAHKTDASRTLSEWLQAHIDVSKSTAQALVTAGTNCTKNRGVQDDLANRVSFDRAVVTHKLIDAGVPESEARETVAMNLEDVRRMAVQRRKLSRVDEERAFTERFISVTPTLDESAWTISGRLPGLMGRIVDKAISQKADELRLLPSGDDATRAQRRADALVAMLQDSLDVDGSTTAAAPTHRVTVFVDATGDRESSPTASIPFGPQIGPSVLESMLCGGSVSVIGMDGDTPVAASNSTRPIPPSVRDAVLFRDSGCAIDGCQARYRLEPHHIIPWSEGGTHDIDNLVTLCWFHHHVSIHGEGYRIDPESPPGSIRLTNDAGRSPP